MHNHALLAQMCGVVTLFDRNIDVVRLALHHTVERQRRLVGENDIAVAQVENIHIIRPCIGRLVYAVRDTLQFSAAGVFGKVGFRDALRCNRAVVM